MSIVSMGLLLVIIPFAFVWQSEPSGQIIRVLLIIAVTIAMGVGLLILGYGVAKKATTGSG